MDDDVILLMAKMGLFIKPLVLLTRGFVNKQINEPVVSMRFFFFFFSIGRKACWLLFPFSVVIVGKHACVCGLSCHDNRDNP